MCVLKKYTGVRALVPGFYSARLTDLHRLYTFRHGAEIRDNFRLVVYIGDQDVVTGVVFPVVQDHTAVWSNGNA